MRIFITGASGYVGSVVTEKALKAGHTVVGLARSEASADKIKKLGATPLLGTLSDLDLLTKTAKESDGVLHLGFVHEFDRPYAELIAIDIDSIKALAKGLEKSNKALIMTSGTGLVQSNGGLETYEDSPLKAGPAVLRAQSEQAAIAFAEHGVRSMVIRLAPYVYGRGGSYFVPIAIQAAAKFGFAPYFGDGSLMTSAADVDASADLYLLALEKGQAGSIFNCTTETDVKFKDLAEAIAKSLNIEAKSVSAEKIDEMCGPFAGNFLRVENRASNKKAREELGWKPQPNYKVLQDIVEGSYKELAQQLKATALAESAKR